ncbi:MAG: hypothetical protein ACRDNP_06155 [Gaiellaceae bacterium]|jgi:hypothetical protein
MSENPVDPIVIGRSAESFAAAAQNAVTEWENQRGGPPDDETTLRVVDMYVTASTSSVHDYVAVLKSSP